MTMTLTIRYLIISAFFFFMFSSCTKSICDINNPSLIGEWQLIEQNISNGGPSKWESVNDGNQFSLFEDGSYEGIKVFSDCDSGNFESTVTELRFMPTCNDSSEDFVYSISRNCDQLTLRPLTVICVEECAYKYERKS